MRDHWTADALLELARGYQPASILLVAAELDLFGALERKPLDAAGLAAEMAADTRATRILADALTALGLLDKSGTLYSPNSGVVETLTADGSNSVLPMLWHQANCMRSWVQLAATVKTGRPAEDHESVRGAKADRAAFIEAMEVASRHAAENLVAALAPLSFHHLLDIGAGPATWTRVFLRLVPEAKATLYDLPEVIPLARRHIEAAGLDERVDLVAGDFYSDAALAPEGELMIRDMVMNDLHTSPPAGALFAINMLVRTESGGTYSFAELREDLEIDGFGEPTLVRGARDMDCVVRARRL